MSRRCGRVEKPEGDLKDSNKMEDIWTDHRALWWPRRMGSLQKATTLWKISSLLSHWIYSYTSPPPKLPRTFSTGELLPPELIVALYPARTNIRNPVLIAS